MVVPFSRQLVNGLSLMLFLGGANATAGAEENAADEYRKAFKALPDEAKLAPAEKEIWRSWSTAVADEATQVFLQKCSVALDGLHRGAGMKQCNWETGKPNKENGPDFRDTYPPQARELAKAGMLRFRFRMLKGEQKAALDDILAVFALARHLNSDRDHIANLVAVAIENTAYGILARDLLQIKDRAVLGETLKRWEQLPQSLPLSKSYKRDSDAQEASMKKLNLSDEDIATVKKLNAEIIKTFALPPDQIKPAIAELDKRIEQLPISLQLMVTPPGKLWRVEAIANTYQQLFRTAIAVAADGPEQVKQFKDPYGKGPFEYRKTPTGFELKGSIKDGRGEPVTLVIGEPE